MSPVLGKLCRRGIEHRHASDPNPFLSKNYQKVLGDEIPKIFDNVDSYMSYILASHTMIRLILEVFAGTNLTTRDCSLYDEFRSMHRPSFFSFFAAPRSRCFYLVFLVFSFSESYPRETRFLRHPNFQSENIEE